MAAKPPANAKASAIGAKPGAPVKPVAKPGGPQASTDDVSVPPPPVVTKPVPKPAIGKGPKPGAANFVPPVPAGIVGAQPAESAEQPKPPAARPLPKAVPKTITPAATPKPAPTPTPAPTTPAPISPRGTAPVVSRVASPAPTTAPAPSGNPLANSSPANPLSNSSQNNQDPAPGDYTPVIFDDESSCVVIGESEYYYPSKEAIATVGQLCSFLESQEDFAGKVIHPLSSRARKIGSREAKSSTVSFIKIEDASVAAESRTRAASTSAGSIRVAPAPAAAPVAAPAPTPAVAPAPAATPAPTAATSIAAAARAAAATLVKKPAAAATPAAPTAGSPKVAAAPTPAPLSSVEKAKLAAMERFKADQKKKEEEEEEARKAAAAAAAPAEEPAAAKPANKLSNKELLADIEDDDDEDKELNFGTFGKTVAPPGRRLPTTRYRKHLDELKKRSKRMEYRQKFFVMEKEKKQEELQKRLDEIDEENLRVERERRKKQEEEYDSLYGAELERKKKLQEDSMASMLDELDNLGSDEPREPLDPDAELFALKPGFSDQQEDNEFAIKPGSFGASSPAAPKGGDDEPRPQKRAPKQRLTLMLKDMLNTDDEPMSADAIVDFSALARAPKKQDPAEADKLRRAEEAKERKMEEIRQKKEELRRREEELNAQLAAKQAKRPGSANPSDLMQASQTEDEPGYKTIMVQGRPRKVPVSASSATLVGGAGATAPSKPLPSAPAGAGRRVKT